VEFLRRQAALAEEWATAHGILSLVAEAAVLAWQAGDTDRASRLVLQVAGGGFDLVPNDVDWLLTVSKATEAAARLGLVEIAREGMTVMAPYAGRCVVNGGAVTCVGVVEDYLWHAAVVIGDPRADDWRAAAAAAYRRLSAPWLLSRVSSSYEPVGTSARPTESDVRVLRLLPGQAVWSVGQVGDARLLPDMKGLHYLRALLQRPGTEVTALDLSAMVARHGTTVAEPDTGPQLDRQALSAYRTRLRDIDEELDEAQSWADPARVERIEAERTALLREVASATGLQGRARAGGGASAERARVAVRKAIAAALERIDADDATTARLLRATVRTGSVCRYEPDPDRPVTWQL
jgi:hypothetical protein